MQDLKDSLVLYSLHSERFKPIKDACFDLIDVHSASAILALKTKHHLMIDLLLRGFFIYEKKLLQDAGISIKYDGHRYLVGCNGVSYKIELKGVLDGRIGCSYKVAKKTDKGYLSICHQSSVDDSWEIDGDLAAFLDNVFSIVKHSMKKPH